MTAKKNMIIVLENKINRKKTNKTSKVSILEEKLSLKALPVTKEEKKILGTAVYNSI